MQRYLILLCLVQLLLCFCGKECPENSYIAAGIQPLDDTTMSIPFDLHEEIAPLNDDSTVNVFVEIPAGFTDKWEISKTGDLLKWDMKDGSPRIIDYLGYPGNYGMIPGTLLPEEQGGDGDPLDAIVLGSAVPRGSIVSAKVIGVLNLTDDGEKDDKLISVAAGSPMYRVSGIEDLREQYPGVTEILRIWFINYKKGSFAKSRGFEDANAARALLRQSMGFYNSSKNNAQE